MSWLFRRGCRQTADRFKRKLAPCFGGNWSCRSSLHTRQHWPRSGDGEKDREVIARAFRQASSEAVKEALGGLPAQLQAAGSWVPTEHRAHPLLQLGPLLTGRQGGRTQTQLQAGTGGLKAELHHRPGGQAAAEAIHESPQHGLQARRVREHRREVGRQLELQGQAAALELLLPAGFQLTEQLAEVGAGQGVAGRVPGRLPLQLRRQENQAKAIDLLAAFPIDLVQPFAHQIREVTAPQQGANQGANRGEGGADLMGQGLQQRQLTARARTALAGTAAVHQRLQGQAGGHRRDPFGQAGPKELRQLLIVLQAPQGLDRRS